MGRQIEHFIGNYLNIMAAITPKHVGKLGFKLFCRPARRRIKARDQQFLDSSEMFSFQHRAIRIQGYRWGSGPKKILLLHGWQSHSGRWKKLVHTFPASDYTVYAIDAPGHGRSGGNFFTAPLYGEVIMKAGEQIGKLHSIVGHSLGAFSTLYAISEFGRPVAKRLIIMATPGKAVDFVSYFKRRLGLNKNVLKHIRNHFEKEIGRPYEDFTISRFAKNLDIPGLIFHDKGDRFTPFGYAGQLNRQWPNSKLLATQGLGHNLFSDEINAEILAFISNQSTKPVNKVADNTGSKLINVSSI